MVLRVGASATQYTDKRRGGERGGKKSKQSGLCSKTNIVLLHFSICMNVSFFFIINAQKKSAKKQEYCVFWFVLFLLLSN